MQGITYDFVALTIAIGSLKIKIRPYICFSGLPEIRPDLPQIYHRETWQQMATSPEFEAANFSWSPTLASKLQVASGSWLRLILCHLWMPHSIGNPPSIALDSKVHSASAVSAVLNR